MMSDKIRDRAVLSRFSDALGRGEIQLYLQAQVGAGDRHVIGAEALSRWVCEDGRVIPPAVFIPIFEEHGKIWQLDYHIWEMACRLLKSWKDDPVFGSYRISVNISVKDIYYLDLYEVFTHLTEEYSSRSRRRSSWTSRRRPSLSSSGSRSTASRSPSMISAAATRA